MADGSIKINIEVDGKQVAVASKELDKLEESGHSSGKGLKSAESGMDSLGDKSSKASTSVKGASDSLDHLGDSGSNASKDLKGADSAIDGLADSSADASSSVKGASDSLDNLGDSGSKAGKDLLGADGAIDGLADSSAGAASGVKGASDSLDGLGDSAEDAATAAKRVSDETDEMTNSTSKASTGVKYLAASIGLIAIASAAFAVMKSSLDAAITRFDTLATFPKVLQALGVSAEDSERAMERLGDGIEGLPTTLNEIASTAQRMYTSFNDMDEATDSAIALNNALLGSGSSAAQAQRGTDQYLKALQTGKMDLMMWNTLSETMDVGLIKIAEGFGYAGKSAKDDLYRALQNGSVTIDQFNEKLIEVGTGTGIMAKLAKENSLGLATSIGNLKNAVGRGVASIIDSFDRLSKEVTGKNIAENIDSLKHIVSASFKAIGSVVEGTTPIIIAFASGVKAAVPVVKALTPAIIGLISAYAAYMVITKASAAIEASNAVLKVAMASNKALTVVTKAQVAAQVLSTGATKADAVATLAQTGAIKLSTIAIGLMTGTMKLSTAAIIVKTAVTYAWGAAIKFLMGPIGWVTAGIALLVTGVIAVVKWFKKSTEEGERLGAQTDKLAESTESLNESVDESTNAYEKNQEKIETNAKTSAELAAQIDELSQKEGKSAADKKLLNSYVEELNESVEGLNLVYGEESDALSMTSEQMTQRIDLMKEQEKMQSSQERLTEIIQEQMEIEGQLEEVNALREEWNQKLDDGSVKSREHKKAIGELEEQEASLSESNKLATEERLIAEQSIVESSEAVAAATEASTGRQLLMFDELSESQKSAVESMKSSWDDYKGHATDLFDVLSEKSDVSVAEMTKNLEENQRIVGKWSENIAKLSERGIDEGLLETLRNAGPTSAGHVNKLVNASDAELAKLSGKFADGGKVATDALNTSLGIEESGVMATVGHLVVDTERSLKQGIAAADFKGAGGDVTDGFADGIDKGAPKAEKASEKMADDTTKAAKKALDSHSPSRVFKTIGTDITEGLVLGINSGTSKVTQAIQKMFKAVQDDSKRSFADITKNYDSSVKDIEKSLSKLPEVTQKAMKNTLDRLKSGASSQVNVMKTLSKDLISPFNNTPSQLNAVGKNAMAGLNAGLNAGRGRVMSTARGIANEVASTMRKALDIHSPSRVMRDGVGLEAVAGVAVGIDENAGMVYKALDRLSSGMISFSTPEIALGTHSMARNSTTVGNAGSKSGKADTGNTTNNNSPITVQSLVIREEADIKKVARELFILQQGGKRVVLG